MRRARAGSRRSRRWPAGCGIRSRWPLQGWRPRPSQARSGPSSRMPAAGLRRNGRVALAAGPGCPSPTVRRLPHPLRPGLSGDWHHGFLPRDPAPRPGDEEGRDGRLGRALGAVRRFAPARPAGQERGPGAARGLCRAAARPTPCCLLCTCTGCKTRGPPKWPSTPPGAGFLHDPAQRQGGRQPQSDLYRESHDALAVAGRLDQPVRGPDRALAHAAAVRSSRRLPRFSGGSPAGTLAARPRFLSGTPTMPDCRIAVQSRGLSKVFGRQTVFGGLDLEIAAGQCVALTGANGAGKTTLLRCLASALRPSAGEVRWFGRPAIGNPDARRLIGMVAHEARLYPHLTLRENLLFAARMCDVPEPLQRAASCSRPWACSRTPTARPARSPRGCVSGWRWRGRSCMTLRSFSSTNRSPASTRRERCGCCACSASCARAADNLPGHP